MTATLTQPVRDTSAPELRIPPISASLLPPEIVEARRTRKVRRAVLLGLAMIATLLAGWFALASLQAVVAVDSHEAAQRDVERLIAQQRAFSEVTQAQAQTRAIEAQLAVLLAGDVRWSRLLTAVRDAAPEGAQLTGVWATLNTEGAAGPAPGTGATGTIGTLTVSGTAPAKPVIAAYVDALAAVTGVGNPILNTATVQEGAVDFRVQLDITDAALSADTAPEED
jgi:hypothetical protein